MPVHRTGHQAADTVVVISEIDNVPFRKYLRPKMSAKKLGIADSSFWLKVKHDPDFPKPIKLGPNTTVFDEQEIDRYMDMLRARQGC